MPKEEPKKQPSLKHLTSPEYGKIRKEQIKSLQDLVRHHVDSFNFMLEKGLPFAVQDLPTYEVMDSKNNKIAIFLEDAGIGSPTLPETNIHSASIKIFPAECRQRNCTYRGKLTLTFKWMVNGNVQGKITKTAGQVPIMVKSDRCRLAMLRPEELVQAHEETEEFGGYFIVNGNERLIRMLIMARRNYPLSINRPSWKKRGSLFTEHGVIMRCVRNDQSSANLTLHYLTDGSCVLQFSKNKQLFFIPVVYMLKALIQTTDLRIFQELTKGNEDDTFLKGCVSSMLRSAQEEGLMSQLSVLKYVGERFRIKAELPPWTSDEDVTRHLLKCARGSCVRRWSLLQDCLPVKFKDPKFMKFS